MLIEKAKCPKGMSYPLRSSVLEQALGEAGIEMDVHLIHRPSPIFFDAFFWPPRPNVPHERLYVRASAVPGARAREARELVETRVVPELVVWVRSLLALPTDSPIRRAEQSIRWELP